MIKDKDRKDILVPHKIFIEKYRFFTCINNTK